MQIILLCRCLFYWFDYLHQHTVRVPYRLCSLTISWNRSLLVLWTIVISIRFCTLPARISLVASLLVCLWRHPLNVFQFFLAWSSGFPDRFTTSTFFPYFMYVCILIALNAFPVLPFNQSTPLRRWIQEGFYQTSATDISYYLLYLAHELIAPTGISRVH